MLIGLPCRALYQTPTGGWSELQSSFGSRGLGCFPAALERCGPACAQGRAATRKQGLYGYYCVSRRKADHGRASCRLTSHLFAIGERRPAVGAGASCSAGGQTMRTLWTSFLRDSPADAEWLLSQKFITEDERRLPLPPLPALSAGATTASTNPFITGLTASLPNFEVLLDRLEIAILSGSAKSSKSPSPSRWGSAFQICSWCREAEGRLVDVSVRC